MEKPNGQGLGRIIKAARCSWDGIGYAYTKEAAFRQEVALSLVLLPCAFLLASNVVELILLIGSLLLLLVVECINSAVEATVDRVSYDVHPLSKQAKDLGSAAVFLTMMMVGLCWIGIGWSRIFGA